MKLGPAIAAIRKSKGLTQDELADKCGSTKPSISRIEKDTQWPSRDTLEQIAEALGVRLYQIFARAEDVEIPYQSATPQETELLNQFRAMEPDAKDIYTALAHKLSSK